MRKEQQEFGRRLREAMRDARLPACLRDTNPTAMWRLIDGESRRD